MSKDTTLNIKTPKNLIATLPDYTLGEELINSISHGLGASFAIIALVLCVIKAVISGSSLAIVSSCLYLPDFLIRITVTRRKHTIIGI